MGQSETGLPAQGRSRERRRSLFGERMARKRRRRRTTTARARWIMAGLFLLGLAIGGAGGFYLRYYALKPEPETRAPSDQSAPGGSLKAEEKESSKAGKPTATDPERASQVIEHLSERIGPRVAGTQQEVRAATYLKGELEKMGYSVGWQEFPLPNGGRSVNLITADPGRTDKYTFLVGAHMDTRSGSPGANDNASGCAAVLEFARSVKDTDHLTEIRFIFFGAEEDFGSARTAARLGSAHYLGTQPPKERAKMVGMVSFDMVSVGPEIHVRDWGPNSPGLARGLVEAAREAGANAYQDPNEKSDHEPFGLAGIPAVWMERMLPGGAYDRAVHQPSDRASHVSSALVTEVVDMVRDYVMKLNEAYCAAATSR